jgi:hypothetical protein
MLVASMSGDELSWFGHATAQRCALGANRWNGLDGASAAATIDGLSGQRHR